jgi:hypothetical protein
MKTNKVMILVLVSVFAVCMMVVVSPVNAIEHECGSPLLYGGQWYDLHAGHDTGYCGNYTDDNEPLEADCRERGFGDQREHETDCYNTEGLCKGNATVYCPGNGSGYGNWITVIANCPNTYRMRAGYLGTLNGTKRGARCTSPTDEAGERECGCTTNGTTSTMFGGSFDSYGRYVCNLNY